MEEEYKILENTVKDFNTKFVENDSMKLENDRIGKDFVAKLAVQGFLSLVGSEGGSTGRDVKALAIVLENLAKAAPAVALRTLLANAFALAVTDQGIQTEVANGEKSGTVTISDLLVGREQNGSLKIEGGRLKGGKKFVLGSDSDFVVTLIDSGEMVLIKSGFTSGKSHKRLGFRSIGFSEISVDTTDFTILEKNGREALQKMYDDLAIPVAAISLGMAEGVSQKAVEYAKVRTAFGHYLKDFQPLAFELTSQIAEMEVLKRYFQDLLTSTPSGKEALFLKQLTLTLGKDISRTSLQIHGGYGYLEDFGIEKFYRDSMALSVLFHNDEKDMERLSGLVFESRAGFV